MQKNKNSKKGFLDKLNDFIVTDTTTITGNVNVAPQEEVISPTNEAIVDNDVETLKAYALIKVDKDSYEIVEIDYTPDQIVAKEKRPWPFANAIKLVAKKYTEDLILKRRV